MNDLRGEVFIIAHGHRQHHKSHQCVTILLFSKSRVLMIALCRYGRRGPNGKIEIIFAQLLLTKLIIK